MDEPVTDENGATRLYRYTRISKKLYDKKPDVMKNALAHDIGKQITELIPLEVVTERDILSNEDIVGMSYDVVILSVNDYSKLITKET